MAVDKQSLLDAVAAAGTKGAADYKAAQDSLAAQQAEAVRMALSSGIAGNANQGAQTKLAQIIGQPYQDRTAQLTSNNAAMQDYYGRLGASAGAFTDQVNGLIPAMQEQFRLSQAGSGGGGGGGGSSGTDLSALAKSYGGYTNLQDAIKGQAAASGDPYSARQIAIQMGVPADLAAGWFKYADANDAYTQWATQAAQAAAKAKATPQQLRVELAKGAPQFAGNQHPIRRQILQAYKQAQKKK